MKRFACLFLLAAVLCPSPARGADDDFVTGEDWAKRMSVREKFMSLLPPAVVFSNYDVHLRLSLPRYIFLMDRIMERNPRLVDEEVANIFASTIYLFEPENRSALREMEMNFLEGDYDSRPFSRPRLTLSEFFGEMAGSTS